MWQGDVEVFDLMQHPKARRAYAWARLHGEKDNESRFFVVLELPPVKDAQTAVQASIKPDSKNGEQCFQHQSYYHHARGSLD
jgi:hypothetical protein